MNAPTKAPDAFSRCVERLVAALRKEGVPTPEARAVAKAAALQASKHEPHSKGGIIMNTTAAGSAFTLREALPEYMGPALAIVNALDHHNQVNADVARAIATLAMSAQQALDNADADHGIRSNPQDEEWWEAEALCVGIAAMATLAAGEGPSKVPGLDRFQAFQVLQTYARMIRTRWLTEVEPNAAA